jgi:hypothetical protein
LEGLAVEDVGIFYGHSVHFRVFCYILWTFGIVRGIFGIFFPVLVFCTKKNLANLERKAEKKYFCLKLLFSLFKIFYRLVTRDRRIGPIGSALIVANSDFVCPLEIFESKIFFRKNKVSSKTFSVFLLGRQIGSTME